MPELLSDRSRTANAGWGPRDAWKQGSIPLIATKRYHAFRVMYYRPYIRLQIIRRTVRENRNRWEGFLSTPTTCYGMQLLFAHALRERNTLPCVLIQCREAHGLGSVKLIAPHQAVERDWLAAG
jgi:hypothetical protein